MHSRVYALIYCLYCIEMVDLLLLNDVDIPDLSLVMIYSSKVVLPSLRLLMIISNKLSLSDLIWGCWWSSLINCLCLTWSEVMDDFLWSILFALPGLRLLRLSSPVIGIVLPCLRLLMIFSDQLSLSYRVWGLLMIFSDQLSLSYMVWGYWWFSLINCLFLTWFEVIDDFLWWIVFV